MRMLVTTVIVLVGAALSANVARAVVIVDNEDPGVVTVGPGNIVVYKTL